MKAGIEVSVWESGTIRITVKCDSQGKKFVETNFKNTEKRFDDNMDHYDLRLSCLTQAQLKALGINPNRIGLSLFRDFTVDSGLIENSSPYWSKKGNYPPYSILENGTRYSAIYGQKYSERWEADNA